MAANPKGKQKMPHARARAGGSQEVFVWQWSRVTRKTRPDQKASTELISVDISVDTFIGSVDIWLAPSGEVSSGIQDMVP